MKINKSYTYSFSPTGTTEKVLKAISNKLPNNEFQSIVTKSYSNEFTSEDLVAVGGPVFGGRIPEINLKNIKNLKGKNTPAIAVVTYGNREYDDALLELVNILNVQGFKVISASAFIARHSMSTEIAKTRPNIEDLSKAEKFALDTLAKIETIDDVTNYESVKVNGNFPYKKFDGLSIKPKATSQCNKCGACCTECPTKATPKDTPNKTDKSLCITCMRCVNVCSKKARQLNKVLQKLIGYALKKSTSEVKQPEFFI